MDWRRMDSDGTLVVLIVLGTLGFGASALAVALVILGLPGGAWWFMLMPIIANLSSLKMVKRLHRSQ